MSEAAGVTVHDERTLGLDACGVAFQPGGALLAAGTYTLIEAEGRRVGCLHLLDVAAARADAECAEVSGSEDAGPAATGGAWAAREVAAVPTSGVFDHCWEPRGGSTRLAQAGADGAVTVYALTTGDETRLEVAAHGDVAGDALCTCVDWAPRAGDPLAVSASDGYLRLVALADAGVTVVHEWLAHELEMWAAHYDVWSGVLYSGADDSYFKGWDVREGGDEPAQAFGNRREHGAGVCCVRSSPHREHVVLTGSYDGNVRLWDVRAPGAPPVVTTRVDCGGGCWRASWHPERATDVAVAAMHGGAALVSVDASAGDAAVSVLYAGHGSFVYGADWFRGVTAPGQPDLVATCAFYDKSLHLWSPVPARSPA